ncbi:hypothetical protein [Teichococcus deserti]|nr:hypothetical protein [Pseudoroseomonas deserti]
MVNLTPEQVQAALSSKLLALRDAEDRLASGVQQVRHADTSSITYQDAEVQRKVVADLKADIAALCRLSGQGPGRVRQVYYTSTKGL